MSETVREIELKQIHPNRLNPRLEINISRLNELAASIKEVGLLEPIIVRPLGNEYEVVVGERRYRASQQVGLEKVLAVVREYSDDQVVQLNLIENIQREELSAIEKGKICRYLLEKHPEKYPSQTAVAQKIGISSNSISLWMKTVEVVPKEAQRYVAPSTISGQVPEGKIDYSTAVEVGRSIKEPEKRIEVIKKLAEKRLPVKERTQLIKKVALEPEKSVEEAIEEITETPCELQFRADDKATVLNGTKSQISMRNTPDSKIKAGTIVHATILEPHVADLRITTVERKKLRYFDEEDAKREGNYTLEEFKKMWKSEHGEWDENQLVYVIRFELLK